MLEGDDLIVTMMTNRLLFKYDHCIIVCRRSGIRTASGVKSILTDILYAILRTAIAFVVLIVMTRTLGRKALSQMTFFDFAVVITFGSVTANVGIGMDNSFHTGITVLISVGLLGLLSGYLHIKSFRFRKLINSEPLIVIENGVILEANMRKGRITINELNSMLRFQKIFNIADVHYAILENSGTLSVLLKAAFKPLTPQDMQINPTESGITKDIIIDGQIMHENLNSTNMTEAWLHQELGAQGITDVRDVFFAALASNGSLYVSKRTYDKQEKHGEHGID